MGLSGGCTPTYRGYNPFCIIGRGLGPPCESHVTFTNITLSQSIHFKIVVFELDDSKPLRERWAFHHLQAFFQKKMSTESTGHFIPSKSIAISKLAVDDPGIIGCTPTTHRGGP